MTAISATTKGMPRGLSQWSHAVGLAVCTGRVQPPLAEEPLRLGARAAGWVRAAAVADLTQHSWNKLAAPSVTTGDRCDSHARSPQSGRITLFDRSMQNAMQDAAPRKVALLALPHLACLSCCCFLSLLKQECRNLPAM